MYTNAEKKIQEKERIAEDAYRKNTRVSTIDADNQILDVFVQNSSKPGVFESTVKEFRLDDNGQKALKAFAFAYKNPKVPQEDQDLVRNHLLKTIASNTISSKDSNVSLLERFKIGFETNPEVIKEYFKRKGTNLLDARINERSGAVELLYPGESQYREVDPDGFDLGDVVDIVPDLLEGALYAKRSTQLLKAAGPVGAAVSTAIGGAVAGGVDLLRQGVSKMLGIRENIDFGQTALATGMGGLFEGASAFGKAKGLISKNDAPKVKTLGGKPLKPNAQDIVDATAKLPGSPKATPGQIASSQQVIDLESALRRSPGSPLLFGKSVSDKVRQGTDKVFEGTRKLGENLLSEATTATGDDSAAMASRQLLDSMSKRIEKTGQKFQDIAKRHGSQKLNTYHKKPALDFLEEFTQHGSNDVKNLAEKLLSELKEKKTLKELNEFRSGLGGRLESTAPKNKRALLNGLYGRLSEAQERAIKQSSTKILPDAEKFSSLTQKKKIIDPESVNTFELKSVIEKLGREKYGSRLIKIRTGDRYSSPVFEIEISSSKKFGQRVRVWKNSKELTSPATHDLDTAFGSGLGKGQLSDYEIAPAGIKISELPKFLKSHDPDGEVIRGMMKNIAEKDKELRDDYFKLEAKKSRFGLSGEPGASPKYDVFNGLDDLKKKVEFQQARVDRYSDEIPLAKSLAERKELIEVAKENQKKLSSLKSSVKRYEKKHASELKSHEAFLERLKQRSSEVQTVRKERLNLPKLNAQEKYIDEKVSEKIIPGYEDMSPKEQFQALNEARRNGHKIPLKKIEDTSAIQAKVTADKQYEKLNKDIKLITGKKNITAREADIENALDEIRLKGDLTNKIFTVKSPEKLRRLKEINPHAYETFRRAKLKEIQASSMTGDRLSIQKLRTEIKRMPEASRSLVFGEHHKDNIDIFITVVDSLPSEINPSGTSIRTEILNKNIVEKIIEEIDARLKVNQNLRVKYAVPDSEKQKMALDILHKLKPQLLPARSGHGHSAMESMRRRAVGKKDDSEENNAQ